MSRIAGYALTIAGCPYTFTTAGVSSVTSTHDLWQYDDATVAAGWLDWPTGTISERAKPLDGDLDVSGMSFRLHDATADGGTADGFHLLSRLAARDPARVTSTPLAASVAAGATTITVGSGAALGSLPRWVWVERECIRIASRVGNVLTVAASGRGALGTRDDAHTIVPDASVYPEVYADIPWTTRRKVILWRVLTDGTATPAWIGFAVRAPRLSDDGARFDLPCDPLWQVLRQAPVGAADAMVRLVGYGRTGIEARGHSTPTLLRVMVQRGASALPVYAFAQQTYRDFPAMARALLEDLDAQMSISGRGGRMRRDLRLERGTAQLTLEAADSFSVSVHWIGQAFTPVPSFVRSGSSQTAIARIEGVPAVAYVVLPDTYTTLQVSSFAGFPATWGDTLPTHDGGHSTSRVRGLRLPLSDSHYLAFSNITTSTTDGPRVTGLASLQARKYGAEEPSPAWILKNPPPLQLFTRVQTSHWAYGLRYGIATSALVEDLTDAADLDWSDIADVVQLTEGLSTARDWVFDGRREFGSVVRESCLIFGCSPILRDGAIGIHAWRWPRAGADRVELTEADLIGKPSWSVWMEGVANRIKVQSDALRIDATDQGSRRRYGPGRQIDITLAGVEDQASVVDDPVVFSRGVLARMALWTDPLQTVRIVLPAGRMWDRPGGGAAMPTAERFRLGAEFVLSAWMLPDGAGDRGMTDALCTVIAREEPLGPGRDGGGTVTLEALVWTRTARGYAPCARVESMGGSSSKVILSPNPVDGSTGYSGGADVETFSIGDVVQLIERDSTTLTTETRTIAAVNTGTREVTFTVAVSAGMQTAIAGGWVDMRTAPWGSVAASQQAWMFIGAESTSVIGGTSEPARPIAP